jgi:hypothetical protein
MAAHAGDASSASPTEDAALRRHTDAPIPRKHPGVHATMALGIGEADMAMLRASVRNNKAPRRRRTSSLPETHLQTIVQAARVSTEHSVDALDAVRSLRAISRRCEKGGGSTMVTRAEVDTLAALVDRLSSVVAEPAVIESALRARWEALRDGGVAVDPAIASHLAAEFAPASYPRTPRHSGPPSEQEAEETPAASEAANGDPPAVSPAPREDGFERVVAVLSRIGSWEFDIFALAAIRPHNVIETVAWECLRHHGIDRLVPLNESKVRTWLNAVENGYNDPPYHNRVHGADVTQTTFWMTWHADKRRIGSGAGLGKWLRPDEVASLILGAATHDTGHFGRNNPFLIKSSHPLALRYNDKSPLEAMHVATAFELMQKPEMDWIEAFPPATRRTMRADMISIILATDNAEHFRQVAALQQRIQAARARWTLESAETPTIPEVESEAKPRPPVVDLSLDEGTRLLVKGLVLHAADVSNPAKRFELAAVWADRIRREFYEQGDEERDMSLDIAPGFDRFDEIPMPKFQLGFIRAIVQPLFLELAALNCADLSKSGHPDGDNWVQLGVPLRHLESNVASWEERLKLLGAPAPLASPPATARKPFTAPPPEAAAVPNESSPIQGDGDRDDEPESDVESSSPDDLAPPDEVPPPPPAMR